MGRDLYKMLMSESNRKSISGAKAVTWVGLQRMGPVSPLDGFSGLSYVIVPCWSLGVEMV